MDLIHFRGLNCYFNCAVSIAASWGMQYTNSFAMLWSETDFTYSDIHAVYSTKRMLVCLEAMGMKLRKLDCVSKEETAEDLRRLQEGELLMAGMDAFHIPWSPIYQALHDPHYFFMRKENPGLFVCFDPTYKKECMQIGCGDLVPYAYDMLRVEKVAPKPLHGSITEEAREVMRLHPQTLERLLGEINECGHEKENAALLGKYTEALINNRYLYKHYLQASDPDAYQQFFGKDFFVQWDGVKNGLFKASLIRNNESVIREVSELLTHLFEEEIGMAKRMVDCPAANRAEDVAISRYAKRPAG